MNIPRLISNLKLPLNLKEGNLHTQDTQRHIETYISINKRRWLCTSVGKLPRSLEECENLNTVSNKILAVARTMRNLNEDKGTLTNYLLDLMCLITDYLY